MNKVAVARIYLPTSGDQFLSSGMEKQTNKRIRPTIMSCLTRTSKQFYISISTQSLIRRLSLRRQSSTPSSTENGLNVLMQKHMPVCELINLREHFQSPRHKQPHVWFSRLEAAPCFHHLQPCLMETSSTIHVSVPNPECRAMVASHRQRPPRNAHQSHSSLKTS